MSTTDLDATTLPGRADPMPVPDRHRVLDHPLEGNFEGLDRAEFAMGCFWGAERTFWQLPGVYTTAAGYAGGGTPNPTYREVCTGQTGHAETVLVLYDPGKVSYEELLTAFWENHDPTQGMQQGNDVGSQYRSAIFCTTSVQREAAERSRDAYAKRLHQARRGAITTEIRAAGPFYYAEPEHQQYLAAHPDGYCGLGGTGVRCSA